jgi:hypothetical protein
MFYKAVAASVVSVFAGVFWLSGASSSPTASERLIEKPVDAVYAALSDVDEVTSWSIHPAFAELKNTPSVEVRKSLNQSITWLAKSGPHKTFDLTLRLSPSADHKSTHAALEYIQHPLPADFAVEPGFMGPEEIRAKIGVELAQKMSKVDPEFASEIKREAVAPAMRKAMGLAIHTATHQEEVAQFGADQVAQGMRDREASDQDAYRQAQERALAAQREAVSFEPGKPMVDVSSGRR